MSKQANEGDNKSVGLEKGIEKLEMRRDNKEERRVAGELKGQRVRGWTEKLLTRTMSGVIYVLVIVGCLLWGIWPTAVLMSAMAWLCCSEFFRISRMAGRRPSEVMGLAAALAFPMAASVSNSYGIWLVMAILFLLLLCVATWFVFNPRANLADVAVSVFGPIYTSLSLSCLVQIRSTNAGLEGAILALITIGSLWAEDSLAYLVGSALGKHKMAPRTSPNKSWEGFFGGLLGSLLVWCAGALFKVGGLSFPIAIACGMLVGVGGVLGDLFESRIKRGVGVKDSGNILPGHGGLLDRTDSILFGSVIAYFMMQVGGIL